MTFDVRILVHDIQPQQNSVQRSTSSPPPFPPNCLLCSDLPAQIGEDEARRDRIQHMSRSELHKEVKGIKTMTSNPPAKALAKVRIALTCLHLSSLPRRAVADVILSGLAAVSVYPLQSTGFAVEKKIQLSGTDQLYLCIQQHLTSLTHNCERTRLTCSIMSN